MPSGPETGSLAGQALGVHSPPASPLVSESPAPSAWPGASMGVRRVAVVRLALNVCLVESGVGGRRSAHPISGAPCVLAFELEEPVHVLS